MKRCGRFLPVAKVITVRQLIRGWFYLQSCPIGISENERRERLMTQDIPLCGLEDWAVKSEFIWSLGVKGGGALT